jgi:hypothetical protein
LLDGAAVVRVADLSTAVPTGRTRHFVGGEEAANLAALAVARYEEHPGYYLFYCDDEWNVITDTYHESVEDADAQAEFEFGSLDFHELH